MQISLPNVVNPFRFIGTSALVQVSIDILSIPLSQRVIGSVGLSDVVNGVPVLPVAEKVSGVAFLRWLDSNGRVQGSEETLSFLAIDLQPPNNLCAGFELYFKYGVTCSVVIINGGGSVDFKDYYSKSQVDALLAGKQASGSYYTQSQIDTMIASLAPQSSTYTKSEVLALLSSGGSGFTFDQVATPTATVNGQTWRQRDTSLNIIEDWSWHSSISKWLSLESFFAPMDLTYFNSNTIFQFTIPLWMKGFDVYLDKWQYFLALNQNLTDGYRKVLYIRDSRTNQHLGTDFNINNHYAGVRYEGEFNLGISIAENDAEFLQAVLDDYAPGRTIKGSLVYYWRKQYHS